MYIELGLRLSSSVEYAGQRKSIGKGLFLYCLESLDKPRMPLTTWQIRMISRYIMIS